MTDLDLIHDDAERIDAAIVVLTETARQLANTTPGDTDLLLGVGTWSGRIRAAERSLADTRRSWERSALELSDGQTVGESDADTGSVSIERVPERAWYHNWPRIVTDVSAVRDGPVAFALALRDSHLLPVSGQINRVRYLLRIIGGGTEQRIAGGPMDADTETLDGPHTTSVVVGEKVVRS
ncbi:MAG: hypothetical protein GEU73_07770 [Chloroflexi bacterium]|nr:hypothetical protein [Chloroflexota bacterium]